MKQRLSPRSWSLRKKAITSPDLVIGTAVLAVLFNFIQGAKAQDYPDYSPLRYQLLHTYEGPSFFDHFNYYSDSDPTDGFVTYVTKDISEALNLTHATDTTAALRVDASTPNPADGRNSVRVESKATYDSGRFVFDIIHTPYGCGTWPALWLTDGANWPQNGEIDILESHNHGAHGNELSLHTTAGCDMNVERRHAGMSMDGNCDIGAAGNAGCAVIGDPSTYGVEFNTEGGGVYALELRTAGIRIWNFPRSSIPSDIHGGSPDPSTWGTPLADFPSTNCDVASHFRNLNIVANIDLCGQLARMSSHYTQMYGCPGSCADFVASNPSQFEDAYWEIGGIWVYNAS
ncbi:putative endo-1,3(4)-beta-glucanase [Penicillium brasilianum]|uniref:endo-1,3(4)-beta-glucanase n=1 Tax=Penicillium brasilianum TaxID=104259 RepID=A0A1S9RU20_PENBI|nr:putative endo-1,3(4)-beta-glucanase [Penicillium brasilianum]